MSRYQMESDIETRKRSRWLQEFMIAVIDPDERPIFVSDAATVFDISSDDEDVLAQRCIAH